MIPFESGVLLPKGVSPPVACDFGCAPQREEPTHQSGSQTEQLSHDPPDGAAGPAAIQTSLMSLTVVPRLDPKPSSAKSGGREGKKVGSEEKIAGFKTKKKSSKELKKKKKNDSYRDFSLVFF